MMAFLARRLELGLGLRYGVKGGGEEVIPTPQYSKSRKSCDGSGSPAYNVMFAVNVLTYTHPPAILNICISFINSCSCPCATTSIPLPIPIPIPIPRVCPRHKKHSFILARLHFHSPPSTSLTLPFPRKVLFCFSFSPLPLFLSLFLSFFPPLPFTFFLSVFYPSVLPPCFLLRSPTFRFGL